MGRPDMAIFSFTKNILENKAIQIFNRGKMIRDFTYIDDIVNGIIKCLNLKKINFKIFNLGNQKPVQLMYLIKLLEKNLKKKAKINFTKYKKTEMEKTHSSNKKAFIELKYRPKIKIEKGIKKFIACIKNIMENKIFIIAEIGWNHMGNMKLAEKMIIAAKKAGADFCKFQTWRVKNLVNGSWDKDGRKNIYIKAELDDKKHYILKQICKKYKIGFFKSVFYMILSKN